MTQKAPLHQTSQIVRVSFLAQTCRPSESKRNSLSQSELLGLSRFRCLDYVSIMPESRRVFLYWHCVIAVNRRMAASLLSKTIQHDDRLIRRAC